MGKNQKFFQVAVGAIKRLANACHIYYRLARHVFPCIRILYFIHYFQKRMVCRNSDRLYRFLGRAVYAVLPSLHSNHFRYQKNIFENQRANP